MDTPVIISDQGAFQVEATRLLMDDQTRGIVAGDAKQAFCDVWPTVADGLQLLYKMAPAIPGVGWMVALYIPVILAAGEAARRALCPNLAGS